MKFEDHCRQARETLGDEFAAVHKWLDEFAGAPGIGMRHRRYRHHVAGIEEIRGLHGDPAAEAARQHIEADLREEGWKPGDHMPANERDYVRMGLF